MSHLDYTLDPQQQQQQHMLQPQHPSQQAHMLLLPHQLGGGSQPAMLGGLAPNQQQQQQLQQQGGGRRKGGAGNNLSPSSSSKVLHVRGLPPYTSEGELVSFFSAVSPATPITRILMLPNSNQAFIQMGSQEAAQQMLELQEREGGHLLLKGKTIILQFSNRQEIQTPQPQPPTQQSLGGVGVSSSSSPSVVGGPSDSSSHVANSILLVTVLNTRVPVTLDHIHQIFKPYGDVLKIITFHKNGVFKALVQMGAVESAVNARMMLEGKDIFQGCCHLRIGFSSLPDLHVKAPGNNARDFTTPSGATHTFAAEGGAGYGNTPPAGQTPYQAAGLINSQSNYGAQTAYADPYASASSHPSPATHASPSAQSAQTQPGCVVLVSNLPEGGRVNCDVLFTLFGVYGDVQRVKILYNKRDTALVQYMSPHSAYLASLHLNHLQLYGKQISVTPSKHVEVSMPKPVPHTAASTPAEQEQQAAMAGLTVDYTHSPIHRFKRTAGAATAPGAGGLGIHAKSIHPPSTVLHVSSLADAVTEDELRQLFGGLTVPRVEANGEVKGEEKVCEVAPVVQFFTSTPRPPAQPLPVALKPSKQAFVRFESVSAAVECLIHFHNYNLHGRYLRISFSGKEPQQVHDTIHGVPVDPARIPQPAGANASASSTGQEQGQSPQTPTDGNGNNAMNAEGQTTNEA